MASTTTRRAERTRHKLRVYRENQLDTIPLYPADIISGWPDRLIDRIGGVMEERAHFVHGDQIHRDNQLLSIPASKIIQDNPIKTQFRFDFISFKW